MKVAIYGTHPTRSGYARERQLMSIPAADFREDAQHYISRLVLRDGFALTRITHGAKTWHEGRSGALLLSKLGL